MILVSFYQLFLYLAISCSFPSESFFRVKYWLEVKWTNMVAAATRAVVSWSSKSWAHSTLPHCSVWKRSNSFGSVFGNIFWIYPPDNLSPISSVLWPVPRWISSRWDPAWGLSIWWRQRRNRSLGRPSYRMTTNGFLWSLWHPRWNGVTRGLLWKITRFDFRSN